MAEGLNRVQALGNLPRDAELRMTQGGQAVLKFSVACNERYKDRSGAWKERTEYINFVLWGKRAEGLSKYMSKGTRVYAEGALRTSSYDDKDGNKRYRTEVNATNVILLGSKNGGGSRAEPAAADYGLDEGSAPTDGGSDDYGF